MGFNQIIPLDNMKGSHVVDNTQRDAHMQRRNLNIPISSGVTLLIAAAACVLGALVPDLAAVIVAGVLVALAIVAFALRRGGRILETILSEELTPLLPLPAEEAESGTSQPETDFVFPEQSGRHRMASERGDLGTR